MLMRWDPFRDWDRLTYSARPRTFGALDAWREDDKVVVALDLPGVDPTTVDVTAEKDVLTVKAERVLRPGDHADLLVRERPQGTVSRRLFLGQALDTDGIEARYADGVLTLTIPVAERARARRVEVTTGSAPVAIAAGEAEQKAA